MTHVPQEDATGGASAGFVIGSTIAVFVGGALCVSALISPHLPDRHGDAVYALAARCPDLAPQALRIARLTPDLSGAVTGVPDFGPDRRTLMLKDLYQKAEVMEKTDSGSHGCTVPGEWRHILLVGESRR